MIRLSLLIALFLSGCSANQLLKKAIRKGAKIQSDTTYVDVVTERTVTDTTVLIKDVLVRDTVTINTTRWRSKTVFKNDTIWQEVECKPDTLRVPFKVETTISSPSKFKWWHLVIAVLVVLGVGVLVKR